jgi:gamma-glutamyltranspeptidase/glutathione hydrolase
MAEAMKIYWADRDRYMGDPDYATLDPSCYYPPPPVEEMISKEYAAERRSEIHPRRAGTYEPGEFNNSASLDHTPPELLLAFNSKSTPYSSEEPKNTTHVTAIDIEGNVITMTQTLMSGFGSCVALPGSDPGGGMMLNNTMLLFDPDPRCTYERANGIAPNKRMLSSMSPTLVLKDEKPFMALGTPGGTRIFSTVMQGIINVIDHAMNIQQAVEAPRIWTMMYGDLNVEHGYPDEVVAELEKMGHSIRRTRTVAGNMNGIVVDLETGLIHGGACWRRDGTAAGWSGGEALSSELNYPPCWD